MQDDVMNQPKLSILIAAYNEEGSINEVINGARTALPSAEIIVVDDGSRDGTLYNASRCKDDLTKIYSIPHKGKGYAIKKAIIESTGTIMAQIDSDLQFLPEELPVLIKPILDDKADIVLGSRYLLPFKMQKNSVIFVKRLGSYVISRIISAIYRQNYTDIFSGFKAWKTDAIRNIDIQESDFTYEIEILIKAKKKGYRVKEVPVSYRRRVTGKTKLNILYVMITLPFKVIKLLIF